MGKYSIDEETLDAIAEGARNAIGTYDSMTPEEMAERLKLVGSYDIKRRMTPPVYEKWIRPSQWPDIDALFDSDDAEDVMYMTYDANQKNSAIAIHVDTIRDPYIVEIGHTENDEFIIDESHTIARNTNYIRWTNDLSGFIVIRITGLITAYYTIAATDNSITQQVGRMPIVQRAARLPNAKYLGSYGWYDRYRWGTFFLEKDRIENGDGQYLTHLYYSWYNCHQLQVLDVSKLKTQNVTTMVSVFLYCRCLSSIDISHFNTENVTNMSYAFAQCLSLHSLDLTGCDFSKCTNWSYAFQGDRCLKFDNFIDGLVKSSVTNTTYMFESCEWLNDLDLSTWDMSGITNAKYMFNGCWSLKTIKFPNQLIDNMTDTSYMFNACRGLIELDLSNFDFSKVTTTYSMFNECRCMRRIIFGNFDNYVLTSIGEMFDECYELTELDVSWMHITNVCKNIIAAFRNCRKIKELNLPEWDVSGLSNGNNATSNVFQECHSLKRITGISNWTFRTTNTIGGMFMNCYSLTDVDVSNWDVSTVNSIGSMFNGCWSLKQVDLTKWRPGICNLGSVFAYCYSLEDIGDLSNWNPTPTTLASMFLECFSLRYFPDFTKWDLSQCTSLVSMFQNARCLLELSIPNLELPKCTSVANMFDFCYNLKSIDVSNWSIPLLNTAPGDFFSYCWALKDVIPPSFPFNHSYVNDYSLTHESAIRILEALPNVNVARTIRLNAWILQSLTPEEKKIATDKGWTLAN